MSVVMKDSGIDWIGNVPKHWEVAVLKRLLQINNGADYKAIESDSGIPVIGSGGQFAWAKEYMYDGEVVLLGRKGTIDRPLYYNGKFWAVDTMFYSIPTDRSIGKFAYYMSICLPFRLYSTSTALPSMTQTILGNMNVVFPQKEEQSRIANFLDKKCAEIDELIALQEQMIAQLTTYKQAVITETVTKGLDPNVKMKDSGVEWIGEIPEHWETKPFKSIYSLGKGLSITKADLVETGLPVISYGQIHSKENIGTCIKDTLIRFVPEKYMFEGKQSMVNLGDIIFADTSEDREGCGNCIYIDKNMTLFAGYHTIIARNVSEYKNKYFSYLFKTDCWRIQLRSMVNGVKLFSIPQKLLSTTSLLVPSLSEQQSIANYLDQKCKEIDELISVKKEKIEKLKAYKKSVIFEYVTGKKQVN